MNRLGKVIFIDDEESVRDALKQTLELTGLRCRSIFYHEACP